MLNAFTINEHRLQQAEKEADEEEYRMSSQAQTDYLKLLATNGSSDEDNSNSDNDEDYNSSSDEDTPKEPVEKEFASTYEPANNSKIQNSKKKRKRGRNNNTDDDQDEATKAAKSSASRWFSNPAFSATMSEMTDEREDEMVGKILNDANSEDEGEGDLSHLKLDIGEMPKTDKQIR